MLERIYCGMMEYLIVHAQNCSLYVLFQFFCEVVLHNDEIVEIRTFKKGILLDKYLDEMSLPK
jgi:hypothetical protein